MISTEGNLILNVAGNIYEDVVGRRVQANATSPLANALGSGGGGGEPSSSATPSSAANSPLHPVLPHLRHHSQ